jgi:hypothetical protein
MQQEMTESSQNLAHAVSLALSCVESYGVWLAHARQHDKGPLAEGYEECLSDAQKAVDRLRALVERQVRCEKW